MNDMVWAIFEVILPVALLFALLLLLLPAERAQRIVRFLKRFLFGRE